MISSTTNSQIKNVIQLQTKAKVRREQDEFVVEGLRICFEVPRNRLVKTFISQTCFNQLTREMVDKLLDYEIVSDSVYKAISDTVNPQGILSVVKRDDNLLENVIDNYPRCSRDRHCYMILEDIQDPGNLGTIIRTSEGAGVSGIIMSKGTVDIYNPKVVRSTMGSIFRTKFCYVENIIEAVDYVKAHGITVYAAHLQGKCDYDFPDYTQPSAFIIGNEGNGISDCLVKKADILVKIPMCGRVESLNAASAATVLMYESFRQNRKG